MKIVARNEDMAMGIDVAKSYLAITVMSNGGVVKQATIAHTRPAIESFVERFPGCRIRAAYEAGCFGYWLCETLRELGVDVTVTPPSKLERAPGDKVKTERRDSIRLAEQLSAGRLRAVSVPSKEERATRQLVRTHEQLKRMRVQVMVRIRSFLEFHHIGVLVECAWCWIRKDKAAYGVYRRIARRREGKRAIVAMARRLAIKIYWQLRQIRFGEQAA